MSAHPSPSSTYSENGAPMTDYMREFDEAVQPVLDAIDGAFQSGKVDAESLTETVQKHVEWWVDEIAAGAVIGCPCAGTPDQADCPHA